MRVWCIALLLLLAGCTSKSSDSDAQEPVAEAPVDDGIGDASVAQAAAENATEEAPEMRWETHEYLFSVGATVGTGMSEAPSTSTHPVELIDASADATHVRVEFLWEGIAGPRATLTLSIGTGTLTDMERAQSVTIGERSVVSMDFPASEWNPDFIAVVASETTASAVVEATVDVRSTAFVHGVPDDEWTAFDLNIFE